MDAFKPKDFDMEKFPYIFLRFTDSVRFLNMATRKFTTFAKFPLSPVPEHYPMGSTMSVHRKEETENAYNLYTMIEIVQEKAGKRVSETKLIKLHFDTLVLETKEKEHAMEGREILSTKTEIVIRPIILNEVNLD